MKNPAAVAALAHLSEQPFWLDRERVREHSALLRAAGLLTRFRPPPLPVAFGPGTPFPAGPEELARPANR